MPELPETAQKLMKGGYTLPTVSVWGDYDEHKPLGDWIDHNTGPDEYYGDGWGGGSGSGSGSDSGSGPDSDHDHPQCTCSDALMVDAADGTASPDSIDKLSTAATAFGVGFDAGGITLGSLEAFAESLDLAKGGTLITKMSNGLGCIGVVSSVTSLIITVSDDGITSDDWDEAAGVVLGAVGLIAGLASAPITACVVGGISIGLAVVSMSGAWGTEAEDHIASLAEDISLSSCPVHG